MNYLELETLPEAYSIFSDSQLRKKIVEYTVIFERLTHKFSSKQISDKLFKRYQTTYYQHVGSMRLVLSDRNRWGAG